MGKKMTNAPVFFAIAQVRFNQVMALDGYAAAIQEIFRKQGFPDVQIAVTHMLNLNLTQPLVEGAPPQMPMVNATRYRFSDIERSGTFFLDTGALSFQTTKYDVYETFSQNFLKGLNAVNEVVKLDFTDRVGIRLLDAVCPNQGEKLADYLSPSVLGLSEKMSGKTIHSFSETVAKNDDISTVSRVIIQQGKIMFPPDIQALTIEEKFSNYEGLHAIIDTDGFTDKREVFNLDKISNQARKINQEIGDAFKAIVTKHALEVWA